ncbi:MAG TPA: glycosyl hydrolase 115 family protein [Povalibacter sp.]|nr:glycosyl hydrolase 115 family protein [Povalibacter sp.]
MAQHARAGVVAWVLGLAGWLACGVGHAAIGDPAYVSFQRESRAAAVYDGSAAAALWLDANDHAGVIRAAGDVQADIERVTGTRPPLATGDRPVGKVLIVAGTVGKSRVIDDLVARGKIDVRDVSGKWETFLVDVVERPFEGVERAVVIAGSDKRGTIYGLYDLSTQMGVSPWYWWADVPTTHRDAVYVKPGRRVVGEPVVKYRGIFLNDEAPALTGWAKEKFGGFNHEFYGHVFELILRLRGNYLWPAMWGSAFIDDDPRNAPLADEYGIVMGTSHHEPLMRAHDEWRRYGQGPWDYSKNAEVLQQFWRSSVERVRDYENIMSIGMRGDGDQAMSEETNVALLEKIVADQREILRDVKGRDPAQVPQLWALYKEVQGYYERGMRVPDDVTLLWCDDNWGNIRRLPTPAERGRAGGAGVYYHFDYVGGPRNYKWLNTIPITKVQEQMNLAWQYDARRIWIVNVGDLKPMEFPIEFFLTMAWDPARWSYDRVDEYTRSWAAREFGSANAQEVAALIDGYTQLNSLRKPEMLQPDTFSLVNYGEAERILEQWRDLSARAVKLQEKLPPEARDAFFQLVAYPVRASAAVQEMYVAVGKNRLYAQQGRSDAAGEAQRARQWFAVDSQLADDYHRLRNGKWNHMMDQINIGYTIWQQPDIEVMPAVSEVHPHTGASLAMAIEGSEIAWPSYGAKPAVLPSLDAVSRGTRWVELFNRGDAPYTFKATTDQPWLHIDTSSGTVSDTVRLAVSANWNEVPAGDSTATIRIEASTGEQVTVSVPVSKRQAPPKDFRGFIESDRHIAIEAPHFTRIINDGVVGWKTLPGFGRTQDGVTIFPVTAPTREPQGKTPRLEYDLYLASTGELQITLDCAPSLDFQSGEGLRIAVSLDDAAPQVLKLDTWNQQNWNQAVAEGIRRVTSRHTVANSGRHTLKVWMITPGVVLERIVVDAGGVRPSYLGPPESASTLASVARRAPMGTASTRE